MFYLREKGQKTNRPFHRPTVGYGPVVGDGKGRSRTAGVKPIPIGYFAKHCQCQPFLYRSSQQPNGRIRLTRLRRVKLQQSSASWQYDVAGDKFDLQRRTVVFEERFNGVCSRRRFNASVPLPDNRGRGEGGCHVEAKRQLLFTFYRGKSEEGIS
ncbi:unnamed protein product, partial [Pylaiella littoralis]